jgi:hypothetical protein
MTKRTWCPRIYIAVLLAGSLAGVGAGQRGSGAVQIDNDDIGGVVTSAKGPEAGVWVIAETRGPANWVQQDRRDRRARALRGARPSTSELSGVGPGLRTGGFAEGSIRAWQDNETVVARNGRAGERWRVVGRARTITI